MEYNRIKGLEKPISRFVLGTMTFREPDKFDEYFIDRTKKIIKCIEKAMGKSVAGLDSEDTIREFGVALSDNDNIEA